MKHRRGKIEEKEAESPPGRGERCKENKNAHRDRAKHPEQARQDVSLVDVSQTGNDTEHHCDHVACFAFRGLCRAAHPIAAVAAFGVFRQKMSAVRARHLIACGRLRRSRRRICIFHLHTFENSQAAPNSSSKQNQKQRPRTMRLSRYSRTSVLDAALASTCVASGLSVVACAFCFS